jgi:hypothetical protein
MLDEREREGTTEEYPHQRISVTFSIIVFTIYRDGSKFRFTLNRANAFLDMSLVLLLHLHNLHDKFTCHICDPSIYLMLVAVRSFHRQGGDTEQNGRGK